MDWSTRTLESSLRRDCIEDAIALREAGVAPEGGREVDQPQKRVSALFKAVFRALAMTREAESRRLLYSVSKAELCLESASGGKS